MNRGAWQAIVHKVTNNWTLLRQLSMHAQHMRMYLTFASISRNNNDFSTKDTLYFN